MMRRTAPGHGAEQGFTLVEVMIALVILAMMTGLIGSALQLHARALARSEKAQLVSEQLRLLDIVAAKLASPVSARALLESDERPVFGTTSSIAVIMEPEIAAASLPGLARYELYSDKSEACPAQQRLMLSRSPVWPGSADIAPYTQERVLLDCVERVSLSYFGRLATAREASWHEAWREPMPPRAVRLQILADGLEYERWLRLPGGGV